MKIDDNIIEFLKAQTDGVVLSFSLGKDSLCCLQILRELEIKFIPFYFYHCPELEFIGQSIERYEKLFSIKIVQLPHPMLYDALRHQDFQPLDRAKMLGELDFPKFTFNQLIFAHLDSIGDDSNYYSVVGMRVSESFNRRMVFKKQGSINHEQKKIFPIHNWLNKDVYTYLETRKIPLPKDYEIWRRSWDGLKYQFTWDLKKHFPRDWETLCEYFPLLELELFRYECNKKYLGD